MTMENQPGERLGNGTRTIHTYNPTLEALVPSAVNPDHQ
jgi:hypothetical protein